MHRNFLNLLLILQIGTIVICKTSYYSIVAPGTIKSNRNYTVCVTLHDAEKPCIIRVGIVGKPLLDISKEVTLQPFQTKSVDFLLPKLSSEYSYQLIAEGVKGLQFTNKTDLHVEIKNSLQVLIQTDKGVYKPGDLVQFRVIILDEHLKPIKLVEPIKVKIKDGQDIRVKQFKDIRMNKGLFTGSFQLSDQPNLGEWTIIVSISGKYALTQAKQFKVEKITLPKFGVYIDTVKDLALDDLVFKATVFGKYTYGQYVEGYAEAKIIAPSSRTLIQKFTKSIENTKAEFEFNLTDLLNFPHGSVLALEATVTEIHTNISHKYSHNINLHNQRYKIMIPENEIEFRDNKPNLIKVKVQYFNGSIVQDRKNPVNMQYGTRGYESFLDDSGTAKFQFDYQEDDVFLFLYKNSSARLPNIISINNNQDIEGDDSQYCSLKLKQSRLQLGSSVELEVLAKSNIPYFIYTIAGHGNIIEMKYIKLSGDSKSHTINIIPSIEMVPVTNIYVHYIKNGNLSFCDIELKFPNEFENQISVSSPVSTVKPGDEVKLNIKTATESRVGILAVDMSVHLLDNNYNIKRQEIFTKLLEDRARTPLRLQYIGQQSGLFTLTNANFVYETPFGVTGTGNENTNKLFNRHFDDGSNKISPIRSRFPETWIFKDIDIHNENTELALQIPDTITTWLVTAFSINEKTGFGMMDDSLNITVFQPFFISTNLPYSVKRGEMIAIPVTIFNYFKEDLLTEVVMNNTDGAFQFMDNDNAILDQTNLMKNLNVPANGGKSVSFQIVAKKVGDIDIRLMATSDLANDAVHKKLKVEPEGIVESHNKDVYLSLSPNGQTYSSSFKANIPKNIIPDSEYITISLGGDVLVSTIENLNDLIQLPTGCGEQNMINFAPNILVLDYLKAIDKTEKYPELVDKAIRYIEIGYQRELTYRHKSGGYSIFGPPGVESTWLTAYVTRFFIKAQKYVAMEPHIVEGALEFLIEEQLSDGEFPNTGHLFYPAHRNKYGFTAFVLMAFLENQKFKRKYKKTVEKSLQFLTTNIDNVNDTYSMAIMVAALHMADKYADAAKLLTKLQTKSKKQNDRVWWSGADTGRSNDVEITSYILMALLESSGEEQFSVFRWLLEKRNTNGGFKSTQDTVVGLQAIVKFSEKQYNGLDNTLLKVEYKAKDEQGQLVKEGVFGVEPDSKMILTQHMLPKSTRSVNFEVVGRGSSLLQFAYQYYLPKVVTHQRNLVQLFQSSQPPQPPPEDNKEPDQESRGSFRDAKSMREESFVITPMAKLSSPKKMSLEICFQYHPKDVLKYQQTNMVILEINLPSGFLSTAGNIKELLEDDLITKIESKNEFTTILIYFDNLQANDEHFLEVEGDKMHDVQFLQPSSIVMYDYYNEKLWNSIAYQIE